MKCPKCEQLGLKSTVTIRHGVRAVPAVMTYTYDYYDEEGKYHNHTSPNSWDYDEYHCSNKHNFTILHATSCDCGWKSGEDKITIHEDDKPFESNGVLFTLDFPAVGEPRTVSLSPPRTELKGKHNPDGTISILEETITDVNGTVRTKYHKMEYDSI